MRVLREFCLGHIAQRFDGLVEHAEQSMLGSSTEQARSQGTEAGDRISQDVEILEAFVGSLLVGTSVRASAGGAQVPLQSVPE